MKKTLYKPQGSDVDISVNVYNNERCFHDALCNDTVGCSTGNVVEGCGGKRGGNFIAGCDGGGNNFVIGCSGGVHNLAEGCGS